MHRGREGQPQITNRHQRTRTALKQCPDAGQGPTLFTSRSLTFRQNSSRDVAFQKSVDDNSRETRHIACSSKWNLTKAAECKQTVGTAKCGTCLGKTADPRSESALQRYSSSSGTCRTCGKESVATQNTQATHYRSINRRRWSERREFQTYPESQTQTDTETDATQHPHTTPTSMQTHTL